MDDFNQALRLNPAEAAAYYNRGGVQLLQGKNREAIADFQQAAELFRAQGNMALAQRSEAIANQIQQGN
jgi:tetratricopeptide (TPR) repeat protein